MTKKILSIVLILVLVTAMSLVTVDAGTLSYAKYSRDGGIQVLYYNSNLLFSKKYTVTITNTAFNNGDTSNVVVTPTTSGCTCNIIKQKTIKPSYQQTYTITVKARSTGTVKFKLQRDGGYGTLNCTVSAPNAEMMGKYLP